ncbi:MAG: hypothetical protein NTY84_14820 [Verrucomicrobia bacterium]|nr:hypothetical protein [Verrucomicrobiota bacterium]
MPAASVPSSQTGSCFKQTLPPETLYRSIRLVGITGGQAIDTQAHGERFGIFVGLWAPTFFILSNRFDRFSEKAA